MFIIFKVTIVFYHYPAIHYADPSSEASMGPEHSPSLRL